MVHTYLESADRDFLIAGDAAGYWELGQKLASGQEFSIYDPPRQAMRMPGYPVFLAASIRIGGDRLLPVRLLQACVGTAACWFVYLLGTLLINERTGLLAASLAAVSPTFVGFCPLILSETLFAATLLVSLIFMATLAARWPVPARRQSPGDAASESESTTEKSERQRLLRTALSIGAGMAIGVACYVRPSWLLTAPLFCLIHLSMTWRARKDTVTDRTRAVMTASMLECVFVLVALAVTLAPWTIRNARVIGHAIPTTLWVGPSLYDGLNPEATGDSDMEFFEKDNLLATMSEYDMDHEYRRRSWQFVRENPGRAMQLGLIKMARFWKPWPNASQFRQWWLCLIVAAFFVPMVGFALLAAVRQRCDVRCLLLTVGPVLYFTVIHSVFVGSLRYRLPAEYPLLILTAAGIIVVQDRLRCRSVKTSVTCTGGVS
ncbi:MAG: glycosyltransferase family 39 protein [Rhodopirellula sp.]|nr:glycosyltransferase family 39 protein [Rhodopirellula sp.]